ncbi:hypothetical protein GHT06_022395 [Daphnia sinensis]|uniref:Microtubule-associated protein Jupiter n=1 Tax=Daphnia sinensis TaxID=1820382 RepID=A0AAD5PNN6_9CRUS|nr:hypothetical protein GHT06_022395 [Daphnia sinensis]
MNNISNVGTIFSGFWLDRPLHRNTRIEWDRKKTGLPTSQPSYPPPTHSASSYPSPINTHTHNMATEKISSPFPLLLSMGLVCQITDTPREKKGVWKKGRTRAENHTFNTPSNMSTHFTVGVTDEMRISSKVLKPPGGGSSDIFGTADLKPAAGTKSNHSDHFSSGSGFGGDLSDMGVKSSSIDSNDGASTPSQTSTSNGSPNNSEPNTPRSGNPVTGEGYSAEAEKKEETPRRGRVPPGGYSSKLW